MLGKAYWGSTPFEAYNSANAFFEHRDWLGSRRAATNSAGTVTNVRTSLAFGDGASNVSGSRDNTFDGYTGLWEGDPATNHAKFREYWNVAGRWLQPDPYMGSYDLSNPQSMNRYAYVLNNPVAYVDPDGTTQEDDSCDDGTADCQGLDGNDGGNPGDWTSDGDVQDGNYAAAQQPVNVNGIPTFQIKSIELSVAPFGTCVSAFCSAQLAPPPYMQSGNGSGQVGPQAPGNTQTPSQHHSKSYVAFLACEVNQGISTMDEAPEPEKAGPYTFAVVNSAPFVFAAKEQPIRALIATGVAAIYDISKAVYIRETCVQQVYGPGYF